MILLVQNSLEYETDLRAMIGAFFPATKIISASPDEVAEFDKKKHSEIFRVFFYCFFLKIKYLFSENPRMR